MTGSPLIRALDRVGVVFLVLLAIIAVAVPLGNLMVPPSSPWHVSLYFVSLFGKYVCYAILALAIDLIWGYCGILSLGHGAFFALGGYAMGMHLMRQIGNRGVYGNPVLPDFMVFLNYPKLPCYWNGFDMCWFAPLILGFLICRAVVTSKLGKVLIAVRDAESRTRFLGYRVESYKLFVFTLSACMAGVAGALYVPQVGIINPGEFAPGNSIEAVIWVAVGGRGTLIGAALGAVVVNYAKTVFTSGPLAPYWLFMLGALFILVTLLLPKGIVGTFNDWWEPWKEQRLTANAMSAAREDGVSEPNMAE